MSSADFNPYSAPLSDLVPEIVDEGSNLWRNGVLLVVRKESVFPDFCVKCNAPAEGWRLKRTLYWHHPAWYLLFGLTLCLCWAGLLLYVIVAIIVRRRMTIQFGLCPRHRQVRRKAQAITIALVIIGFGLIVAGATKNWSHGIAFPVMLWSGIGALVLSAFYGFLAVPSLAPKRIDSLYAKLRGAGPEFLAPLPAWDGM